MCLYAAASFTQARFLCGVAVKAACWRQLNVQSTLMSPDRRPGVFNAHACSLAFRLLLLHTGIGRFLRLTVSNLRLKIFTEDFPSTQRVVAMVQVRGETAVCFGGNDRAAMQVVQSRSAEDESGWHV